MKKKADHPHNRKGSQIMKLQYNKDTFLLDGKPFRILSGAIHYFRVPQAYWEDRLRKLRACGFNTVETYCCWNLHEKQEGSFDFSGMLDIRRFLETAQRVGLYAIVRPGPFICAEIDNGGLPYWLNRYPMRLRCSDPLFLEKTRTYFARLFEELRPMLAEQGGNILALQIENEYGSYGNDADYLRALAEMYRENGAECLFFTSDGPTDFMLTSGTLPEYPATCNFGSRGARAWETLQAQHPGQPFLCTEFWDGWFDHWGEEHHTRSAADTAAAMEEILDQNNGNGNISFYMFHGGTNFGFTAGANFEEEYQPTVTSYDYDAPLSECGDMTEKYHQIRQTLERRYGKQENLPEVENSRKAAYGTVSLTEKAGLFENLDALSSPVRSPLPLTMDELGQPSGFVLYSTQLRGSFTGEHKLSLDGLHDRALIYVDGALRGIQESFRPRHDDVILSFDQEHAPRLDLLVENMGRVNFGRHLGEHKGLTGVRVGQVHHSGWDCRPLPLDDLSGLRFTGATLGQPTFYRGSFTIQDEPCDTFVRLDGFTKGCVFINGFHLGRYWNEQGPQKTLYLPSPFLCRGENSLIVLELEKTDREWITLTDHPDLG